MWCKPIDVLRVLGLKEEEIFKDDVEYFIEDAQREVLNRISILKEHDSLTGSINGVNTTFSYTHQYIADNDFDYNPDMTVYLWSNGTITGTLAISTIDIDNKHVIVTSAPTSGSLTATYYYYPNYVSTIRLKRVTSLLAGYYYILSEYLLIPEQWFHGAYRFRWDKTFNKLLDEYEREINNILRREHYTDQFKEVSTYKAEIQVDNVKVNSND